MAGAVDRRQRAKGQRVLQIAGGPGAPQVAAVEQPPQPPDGNGKALVGPCCDHRRVEDAQVRGEGFEAERAGGAGGVEQPPRVVHRQGGRGGGEGAVVDQCKALARRQFAVAEQAGGEIGQRGEVGLAERAEPPHDRADATVERLDQALRQHGTHAGMAGGEAVGQAHHGRPHHVGGERRALRDAVVLEQAAIEARQLAGGERHPLEHTHAGRQAVDLVATGKRRLDRAPGTCHAFLDIGRQRDGDAVARHAHELVERECRACKDDSHGAVIARRRRRQAPLRVTARRRRRAGAPWRSLPRDSRWRTVRSHGTGPRGR